MSLRRTGTGSPSHEQAGFDEGLEAVADAEDEAVAVFLEIGDRVAHARVAENGRDEFRGSIGFVAGREAAGDEEDLGFRDLVGEGGDGFGDVSCGKVAEDLDVGLCADALEGAGGVVFGVGAGEGGDQYRRSGDW